MIKTRFPLSKTLLYKLTEEFREFKIKHFIPTRITVVREITSKNHKVSTWAEINDDPESRIISLLKRWEREYG